MRQQQQQHQTTDGIEWRRTKVLELSSQGQNQREISLILQISLGTVNRDLSYIRKEAKTNIKEYIDERLPEEYEKCMVGLNSILREAWHTSETAEDKREKIQALSLSKRMLCFETRTISIRFLGEPWTDLGELVQDLQQAGFYK